MPAYNEEAGIVKVVDEWYAVIKSIGDGSKLIIFNDGSTDNTLDVLNNIKNKYPDLIIMNKENTGHGPTCTMAYQYAVAEGADWIFQTDSDGQTKSDDFYRFWEKRNNYDFIIGWRTKRKDSSERRFITQILKWTLFVIFKVVVKDANAPFRLMKSDHLCRYLPLIPADFFLSNVLLSVMFMTNKENVLWQEISFASRASGNSSLPLKRFFRLGINLMAQLYKIRNIRLPK
jgi:glycosyltransferase involved in cell wall biosynthesis